VAPAWMRLRYSWLGTHYTWRANKLSPRAERGAFKATGKVPRCARDDNSAVSGICVSGRQRVYELLASGGSVLSVPRNAAGQHLGVVRGIAGIDGIPFRAEQLRGLGIDRAVAVGLE